MLDLAIVDKLNRPALSWLHTTPLRKYQVSKACLGRLVTLERLISASATVAEEALAEKIGAG